AATPAPADLDLDFRPEASGWQNHASGARINIKRGKGVAISAWQLPAATKETVEIRPQVPGAELFVYVMEGGAEATVGGERHDAGAGVLLVVAPNAPALRLRPNAASVVLVLEAARVQ
ncbi:MAG: hypothetical protein ACKOEC_07905, partial [Acidimicrobiia bacterium]